LAPASFIGGENRGRRQSGGENRGRRQNGGENRGRQQSGGDSCCLNAGRAVRKRSLTGGPAQFGIFPIFQKQLEIVNSKQTSFGAPKILKLCMMLDLSILSNFFNWVDFEFPTQFML
jgi:hypothetical protein